MNNFFELINFYKTIVEFADESPAILATMIDKELYEVDLLKREVEIIYSILGILDDQPDASMPFFEKELKFSVNQVDYYFAAIQILYPGKVKVRHLLGSDVLELFAKKKKKCAIRYLANQSISMLSIAETLNVEVSEIKDIVSNVPALIEENKIVVNLKDEATVRDFFTIHPHSTLRESAKLLQLSPQRLRTIVNKLRFAGEDIKANDTSPAIEREVLGARVINLKINEPSLTTTEISLKLGLSIQEVKRAINDMVRIWQVEKAESYEFHFAKTSSSLDEIKTEAWKQHNAASHPSSRWMEMILSATEKQITMHGLKAPEKLDIRQDIRLTKVERDSVIDAAMASNIIDINYENIQVTGTHD